jgi:hypothetical protein
MPALVTGIHVLKAETASKTWMAGTGPVMTKIESHHPGPLVLQVFTKIAVARAFPIPDWVAGVRVHSSTNQIEARLAGAVPLAVMDEDAGLPVPWPFPWWAAKARL